MRKLIINNQNVDIDDKTVLAVDSESYDITNPAQRLVNSIPTLSVPGTMNNCAIFGFSNKLNIGDDVIYDEFKSSAFVDNFKVMEDAKCYIGGVDYTKNGIDRFVLNINQKNDIWQRLKDYKYTDFIVDYLDWIENDGYNNFQSFCDSFNATSSLKIKLCKLIGTLYDELNTSMTAFIDSDSMNTITYTRNERIVSGGYFSVLLIDVFKFLENKFSVNFNTLPTVGDTTSIFNDPYAKTIRMQIKEYMAIKVGGNEIGQSLLSDSGSVAVFNLGPDTGILSKVKVTGAWVILTGSDPITITFTSSGVSIPDITLYSETAEEVGLNTSFLANTSISVSTTTASTWTGFVTVTFYRHIFKIEKTDIVTANRDIVNFSDVSMFDIVTGFMGVFNVMKIEKGSDVKMYRFDSIDNLAPIDFQGSFVELKSKRITFGGLSLNNKISYSDVFPTGHPQTGGFIEKSLNKSLVGDKDYIAVKGYAPSVRGNRIVLSNDEAFKTICFFVETGSALQTYQMVNESYLSIAAFTAATVTSYVALYSLSGEYNLLKKMIRRPCVIVAKFIITAYEYSLISLFAKYFIPELGGEFVLLSIKGFNPLKTSEPVECTFVKIPSV